MKAVIIDDIPLAIESLKADLVDYCPNIEVVGTANGVVEAAKLLKSINADLLFLDIEMNDGDGFDLLDILEGKAYHVIFTTGSQDFAIKAFQYAAVDYLLKPVDPELLQKAVERIGSTKSLEQPQQSLIRDYLNGSEQNKIALNTQEEIRMVDISKIIRCESMDNYTRFFLSDGSKILVTKTLKEYDNLLSEHKFIRVHQSHLVNLNLVKAYIKTEGGYILMQNGDHIPVSVRKKAELMTILLNKKS